MAHEDKVLEVMRSIKIADKHTIAEIIGPKVGWKAGVSRVNNTYKASKTLVDLGKLVQGPGFFRTHDCRSNYSEHAALLTKTLAELFKYGDPIIAREHLISPISIRPDALCLIRKNSKALFFVLEVRISEEESYLRQKVTALRNFEDALPYFSNLFQVRIPHFPILVKGEPIEGTIEFDRYLKEIM